VADPDSLNTTVTADAEHTTVTANFTEVPTPTPVVQYTLMMAVSGQGATDPVIGTHQYVEVTVVAITAIPYIGWQFASWTGDVGNSVAVSTTVTMDGNKTVIANFVQAPTSPVLTLSPSSGIAGSEVTITGSHWTTGNISLLFGGVPWHVTFADSNGEINEPDVATPASATPGNWTVMGIGVGNETASTTFTVVNNTPAGTNTSVVA